MRETTDQGTLRGIQATEQATLRGIQARAGARRGARRGGWFPEPSRLRRPLLRAPTLAALAVGLALAAAPACDDDQPDELRPDLTAPEAVSDLRAEASGTTWMTLAWTAPGDDGGEGRATRYDLRYRTSPFGASAWDSLLTVAEEPPPQAAGTVERMTLYGLAPATPHFFALRSYDEANNASPVSNVAADTTGRASWIVDQAGGGDFLTIGAALAAAADGDTILIRAGTYAEPLVIEDRTCVLIGAGPDTTEIRYGTSIEESEPAIRLQGGSLSLRNLRVTQPQIPCGTGIAADSAHIEIIDCALIWCGLTAQECDVLVQGTTLYGIPETRCEMIIQVLRLLGGSAVIEGNILAGHPDGVLCAQGVAASFVCNNCWTTEPYAGCPDPTGTDGNISTDPHFIDAASEDFHLAPDSPCLAGATQDCGRMGAFGAPAGR